MESQMSPYRLLVLVTFAVVLGCQGKPSPKALSVSAGDLWSDYSYRDVTGADAVYRGKRLVVRGAMKKHEVDKSPQLVILGTITQPDSMVVCRMSESARAALGKLEKNQVLAIEGDCIGLTNDLGADKPRATLDNCRVVSDRL